MVVAMVEFAHAIALEATLSFLGVGLPITAPSLGLLISTGFSYLQNGEYWISLFPGFALLLLVFSLNLIAERARTLLDSRRERLATILFLPSRRFVRGSRPAPVSWESSAT